MFFATGVDRSANGFGSPTVEAVRRPKIFCLHPTVVLAGGAFPSLPSRKSHIRDKSISPQSESALWRKSLDPIGRKSRAPPQKGRPPTQISAGEFRHRSRPLEFRRGELGGYIITKSGPELRGFRNLTDSRMIPAEKRAAYQSYLPYPTYPYNTGKGDILPDIPGGVGEMALKRHDTHQSD